MDKQGFWERRSLDELSDEEWESLCDGCGRCCLHTFEDEDSGAVYASDVACQLLDVRHCRCTDYLNRLYRVSRCLDVRKLPRASYRWLPVTCAYRRLDEGRGLAPWHPLVSGDPDSVHRAGISVAAFARAATDADGPAADDVTLLEWHTDGSVNRVDEC